MSAALSYLYNNDRGNLPFLWQLLYQLLPLFISIGKQRHSFHYCWQAVSSSSCVCRHRMLLCIWHAASRTTTTTSTTTTTTTNGNFSIVWCTTLLFHCMYSLPAGTAGNSRCILSVVVTVANLSYSCFHWTIMTKAFSLCCNSRCVWLCQLLPLPLHYDRCFFTFVVTAAMFGYASCIHYTIMIGAIYLCCNSHYLWLCQLLQLQ